MLSHKKGQLLVFHFCMVIRMSVFEAKQTTVKWQKVAKVAKSPQIRLQGVSRGFRWFQVSNSMGSDDSGDLRAGTLRVRGARSGPEGP